jgi:hypothetical protein
VVPTKTACGVVWPHVAMDGKSTARTDIMQRFITGLPLCAGSDALSFLCTMLAIHSNRRSQRSSDSFDAYFNIEASMTARNILGPRATKLEPSSSSFPPVRTLEKGENPLRHEAGHLLCRWSFCGGGREMARGHLWFTHQKGT